MSSFEQDMSVKAAYLADNIEQTLAERLSTAGLRQYHLAETEKFAHITTFFNGGRDEAWPGETDQEIPSAQVRGYDELPEMSSPAVADQLVAALASGVRGLLPGQPGQHGHGRPYGELPSRVSRGRSRRCGVGQDCCCRRARPAPSC
ncbi:MAG: hypothetical protein WKG07_13170 [Hymenobacter sp.]